MNQRPRIPPTIVRKLCSILLCGLVSGLCLQDAEAGEAHPRRFNGFRSGQPEARNARQAERMQQRMQQRPAPREPGVQRAPQAPPPVTPPAYQAPEVPAQERANRPGRMTPDERRALRQQINEAGRDVYRPNRP